MRFLLYARSNRLEQVVADAFHECFAASSHQWQTCGLTEFSQPLPEVDVAVLFGLKARGDQVWQQYVAAGKTVLLLDKGYTWHCGSQGSRHWRISINDFHPLAYFQQSPQPPDRWELLQLPIVRRPPDAVPAGQILYVGASQKYYHWRGLGSEAAFAAATLEEAKKYTTKKLVYRARRTDNTVPPLPGIEYGDPDADLLGEFAKTSHLVTYSSNAAVEAVLCGLPVTVLGDGMARPLAQTTIQEVDNPYYPPTEKVQQWAHDLAYCQWTAEEIAAGRMWQHIEPLIAQRTAA
jgi:hypothetical protein